MAVHIAIRFIGFGRVKVMRRGGRDG